MVGSDDSFSFHMVPVSGDMPVFGEAFSDKPVVIKWDPILRGSNKQQVYGNFEGFSQ